MRSARQVDGRPRGAAPAAGQTLTRAERIPGTHHAWVEVDLSALAHNARVLRRSIPADAALGLLVKADAYGHGLEMAARAAVAGGADQLIVANLDEGLTLRRSGLEAPILIVYPIPPEDIAEAVEARLELTVSGLDSSRRALEAWSRATANEAPGLLRLHVEVDTGLGRGGVAPEDLVEAVQMIDAQPVTSIAGIWSHLADGRNAEGSAEQVRRFESAVAFLAATARSIPKRHLAATDGIFAGAAPAYEMVRVGIGFYGEVGVGLETSAAHAALAAELRSAMTVKARPVRIEVLPAGASVGYGSEWIAQRQSMIATLPLGYADGWARSYWPGASALLRGRRVPLVGRVSMDSVCADVSDLTDPAAADVGMDEEFVLLGGQGDERITPTELARLRGSIPHEVFCAFGPRLPRIYLADGEIVAVSTQADRVERRAGTSW